MLPDLGVTDGDRAFHLPLPGAYTVQLAAKPGQNPTVRIDGVQVQLQRIGVKLDSDILSGTVQLEAGTHHLELRTGSRPDPVTVGVTTDRWDRARFSLRQSRMRGRCPYRGRRTRGWADGHLHRPDHDRGGQRRGDRRPSASTRDARHPSGAG